MESLNALIQGMGLMHLGAGQAIMLLVSLLLLWLAIAKKFEPLLLLPIGFGGLLSNIPEAGLALTARLDGCRIRRRPDTAGLLAALAAGDLAGVARRMYNVFEDVLPERRGAEVQRIKNALVQQGALGASMSGTGSTVFGLFDREEAARRAYELLQESYRDTFLARSLEKMV